MAATVSDFLVQRLGAWGVPKSILKGDPDAVGIVKASVKEMLT